MAQHTCKLTSCNSDVPKMDLNEALEQDPQHTACEIEENDTVTISYRTKKLDSLDYL